MFVELSLPPEESKGGVLSVQTGAEMDHIWGDESTQQCAISTVLSMRLFGITILVPQRPSFPQTVSSFLNVLYTVFGQSSKLFVLMQLHTSVNSSSAADASAISRGLIALGNDCSKVNVLFCNISVAFTFP